MGLRDPRRLVKSEEENAMLPGNQIAAQQMAEEQQLNFPKADIDALKAQVKQTAIPTPDIDQQELESLAEAEAKQPESPESNDRLSFYNKLLKEYEDQKKEIKSQRTGAQIGDAIANFLGGMYQVHGGPALGKSNTAAQYDNANQEALNELRVKADFLEKAQPKKDKSKYEVLGDQIVEISPDGQVKPVFQSQYKKAYLDLSKDQKQLNDKKFEYAVEKGDRPSDKQVETITSLDKGGDFLKDVEASLGKYEQYLGPYASKIESFKGALPYAEMDPGFVEAQQLLGIQMAEYVREMTGAVSSDSERAELRENTPKLTDKPEAFRVKLSNLQKIKERQRQRLLENITKQGKDVSAFQKPASQESTQLKQPSDDLIQKYSDMHKVSPEQARQILVKRLNR